VHIVEELIAERAPKLLAKPRLFKAIKPALYKMLAYDSAVEMVDKVGPLTGREAFTQVTENIRPRTEVQDMSNLPETGACIIIANHPTGLADGLAVFQAIRERRPDHVYLANADALRVIPKCKDIIIPVEWVKSKRTHAKARDTLLAVKAALKEERWARNSVLYYVLSAISGELRDITLFYELLNKKGQNFKMKFGTAIPSEEIEKNAELATAEIRKIIEAL